MMISKCAISLVLMLILSSACKDIRTRGGESFLEDPERVQPHLGYFSGQFEGVDGVLKLWLDEGIPNVLYSNSKGNDILANECGSQIGTIREIGKKRTSAVEQFAYMSFWFSAGNCKKDVWGKEIILFFNETQSEITARILKKTTWKSDSSWCDNEPYPGPEWCDFVPVSLYLEGVFDLSGK